MPYIPYYPYHACSPRPHAIGKKGQVTLPRALLDRLSLGAGDDVWFEIVDQGGGCLLVMPAEVVSRVWERGQATAAEQGAEPPYQARPTD